MVLASKAIVTLPEGNCTGYERGKVEKLEVQKETIHLRANSTRLVAMREADSFIVGKESVSPTRAYTLCTGLAE